MRRQQTIVARLARNLTPTPSLRGEGHSLPSPGWGGAGGEVSSRGTRYSLTLTLAVTVLAVYLLAALLAPLLAPYDPSAYSGAPLEHPSPAHLLGTNDVGQDILSELIYGARVSILVGGLAGGLTLALAVLAGMAAGYLGGSVDTLVMRAVDILMAIPHLPLMILVAAYAGSSLPNLILIIALLGWMVPARIVRSQVLTLRGRSHVHAARLFGGGPAYVIRRHLIPAVAPILAAAFVFQAGRAVLMEAGLAFLGLGDPTAKSWGMIIRYALNYQGIYFTPAWLWWLLPPGISISLLILALTFLGTEMEARLDPRLRRHRATAGRRGKAIAEAGDESVA